MSWVISIYCSTCYYSMYYRATDTEGNHTVTDELSKAYKFKTEDEAIFGIKVFHPSVISRLNPRAQEVDS